MPLAHYTAAFATLRADAKPYWPEAALHRAPYKPLLLMAVMDLIAQQVINANVIRLNADLMDAFDLYWVRVVGGDRESNPVMPFNHMRSEGFWHLVDASGEEPDLHGVDRNEIFRRIKSHALGARIDDELYQLLQTTESRDELRRVLIETYFTPDARPTIVEVSHITTSSFAYSRDLLNRSRGRFTLQDAPTDADTYVAEARSAGFRRVVASAYNHTCAMCHVRIVTPEGRTAIAAAHIVPWSHSHNDDPRNGMALCGLHHWVFDQGLIAVTPAYTLQVSPILRLDAQRAEAILALDGREIVMPRERALWPARAALRWHMSSIYRATSPYPLL
ncbi:HNH endonuclease [Oscillochloris sp. ZM17-4]|uniref:HNH endonuclease n=1 Tax=Oscillochloris sp. ZM17-4 TaxID=2866714 RepID=UPI001C73CEFB|nr:HNH endonuclease [Oscillochloris sp. ZM17-4]MBX0330251.1 HNH endonuclease [Oscillochloris sp. ZM17-4]